MVGLCEGEFDDDKVVGLWDTLGKEVGAVIGKNDGLKVAGDIEGTDVVGTKDMGVGRMEGEGVDIVG